ncbi:MAG: DUF4440 domain-containing protein [Pyrinomonadaceae bacterium]
MKKIFVLVSLLVLAGACAAPSTNRDAAVSTNANTNSTAEKSTSATVSEADAIAKEKAIWETIKNKDYAAFGNMLASDQAEVVPDGVYDKARTIAAVKEFEPTETTFSDWKFLPIDKDAYVVIYTVRVKGKYKGKEVPPDPVRASSAWVNREGKWLAMYHQECDVATAPAPAKPAPSPAPSTPITLGPDPIANEKAIWDALKARNFGGFADALASDAVDVEPTGVYDKAGILKAVSEFDFSKVQTSEYKSTPFDSDATLVTYLVKMPAPDPAERDSTIWVKRDGKWLAVFHHGSPVAKAPPAPPAK